MATLDREHTSPSRVRLACLEIQNFRRLKKVRAAIDERTTIFVGANNSGKTSILSAIRKFLSDNTGFGAFDLSVDQWARLRELGQEWEKLEEPPSLDTADQTDWDGQLQALLNCMPTLDLWFDVQAGAFHMVYPLLPSLQWSGGPIGVRIRLEPASTVDDLQKIAWRFNEARRPVKEQDASTKAWPTDLLDYWLRYPKDLTHFAVYKLDPDKSPMQDDPPEDPQALPPTAKALDRSVLKPLLRVDFVPAQRGLGQEEADGRPGSDPNRIGLFSSQVLKFARQNLNNDTPTPSHHPDLIKAVTNAQNNLDTQIRAALAPTIKDVEKLGYPGLHDPQKIDFRTRIHTSDLLNHNTAVQYRMEGREGTNYFPEHTIGLGYQNLQSLSYQLVSFRETRLNPPVEGAPAAVHLVLLEEPEAHLHVQVQRIFPKKALELITPSDSKHSHLSNQLIISTHASHLAHSDSFTRLRYVRRVPPEFPTTMPYSEIINLADVFGSDSKTQAFAERYFHVQHTDLLFADAAIFVEGTAERMLVPFFVERDFDELSRRYLSFLDVGGSHAHRLKPLMERLGIPTVIITDIDPVEVTKGKANKTVRKASVIHSPKQLECGNDTLTKWHPGKTCLDDFTKLSDQDLTWVGKDGTRVRFAWQLPIPNGGPWPSSFEDSFILSNQSWFKKQMDEFGALGKACEVVREHDNQDELNEALHYMLHGSFKKGDFASTIFEKLSLGEPLACPLYISDALDWLQSELKPTKDEGL